MNISVIVIGDELLIGQVIDTNSGDIARLIQPYGWSVRQVLTVSDNADEITRAIDQSLHLSDVVITTGGLGPTKDDITKTTLCKYFGGTLHFDPAVFENIKEVFRKRGLKLNTLTEGQAMVPTSCRVIQNSVGTAPVLWFERDGKTLVSMPGVPFETHRMLVDRVIPDLLTKYHSDTAIAHRTLIVAGLTESAVAMRLDTWEKDLPPFIHLAYLPKPGIIRLRLDGSHNDSNYLNTVIDTLHHQLCDIFKDNLIATSDLTPAEAMLQALSRRNLTIGTAESCTGGNIAASITAVPGSSANFTGSIVSYSNSVKTNILGVPTVTLENYGAVSRPTVMRMAVGATEILQTDCAIATSGIAGPGGGTPDKPVGTVWVAVVAPEGIVPTDTGSALMKMGASETAIETVNGKRVETGVFHLPGDRHRVIDRATTNTLTALTLLLR